MNRLYYLSGAAMLFFLFSCGTAKRTTEDSFYNKYNKLEVKSKKKLFSSRYYTFGPYETGKKEKGVSANLISFKTRENPFHVSLSDGQGNTTLIQAVYTLRSDLQNKVLPFVLRDVDQGRIFYAWIGGGSMNSLKNWELLIKNPTYAGLKDNEQIGVFQSVDDLFSVHANNRFGHAGSYNNMCYEFRLRGILVAAVQVNGDNNVWLDRQLDKETGFALAGAITALLLK